MFPGVPEFHNCSVAQSLDDPLYHELLWTTWTGLARLIRIGALNACS